MTDPIASKVFNHTATIVVDDFANRITTRSATMPDGSTTAMFDASLVARDDAGNQSDQVVGSVNMDFLVANGKVTPDDAAAWRRVVVAAGAEVARQAGWDVATPAAPTPPAPAPTT